MATRTYIIIIHSCIFIDINECVEKVDGCAQNCTNEDGGYSCSCIPGYHLATDGHGCEGQCSSFYSTDNQ